MKPAFAAIPDVYIELALGNDAWFAFVSLLAMVIHVMQAFERAIMRVIEIVILYPLRRIHHTYHTSDPSMIEYYSATCAMIFGIWIVIGRTNSTLRQITDVVPWWLWANPSMMIGLFQGMSVHHGTHNTRALCSLFAFLLWTWLSAITYRRLGFNAIHAFTVPLMLACWLAAFVHIRRASNGSAAGVR